MHPVPWRYSQCRLPACSAAKQCLGPRETESRPKGSPGGRPLMTAQRLYPSRPLDRERQERRPASCVVTHQRTAHALASLIQAVRHRHLRGGPSGSAIGLQVPLGVLEDVFLALRSAPWRGSRFRLLARPAPTGAHHSVVHRLFFCPFVSLLGGPNTASSFIILSYRMAS